MGPFVPIPTLHGSSSTKWPIVLKTLWCTSLRTVVLKEVDNAFSLATAFQIKVLERTNIVLTVSTYQISSQIEQNTAPDAPACTSTIFTLKDSHVCICSGSNSWRISEILRVFWQSFVCAACPPSCPCRSMQPRHLQFLCKFPAVSLQCRVDHSK